MRDTFTNAYIECALWSSSTNRDEHDDKSFQDQGFGLSDLAPEALASMESDCKDFQEANAETLAKWYSECSESEDRAGHDFWLTRNGHGAGFWDRWNSGTPEGKIGKVLTDASKAYGSCDLYLGDDGRIYLQ